MGYGRGNLLCPVLISLDPEPGATGADKLPVQIYVGSDSKLFWAERMFVWAILQVRNPGRRYDIHFMKNLNGFERRGWKTSFSGYRYAVPGFTGGAGRAIYNDVNQVYLSDPALLFDADMNGAAVLSAGKHSSSFMLLDCEQLNGQWTLQETKTQSRTDYFERKMNASGGWGNLPASWHTHELDGEPEKIKLLYSSTASREDDVFTTESSETPVLTRHTLLEMEAAADQARFTLFTEQSPSARYGELLGFYEAMHEVGRPETGRDAKQTFSGVSLTEHIDPIAHLIKLSNARSVLDYGSGKGGLYEDAPGYPPNSRFKTIPAWGNVVVTCYDPGYKLYSEPVDGQYDVVISTDVVEHIPEQDIDWVLDKIFAYARHSVYIVAACYPARKHLPDGTNAHCTQQPPDWWIGKMQQSARHYPDLNWVLCTQEKGWLIFQERKKLRKKGIRSRFFSGNQSHSQEHRTFDQILFQA